MHRNPWWLTPKGPTLDAGAAVVGLEFATGRKATVLGKPSPEVFRLALEGLRADLGRRVPARSVAMVGDDPVADVRAAQRAGLRGILVLTGKTSAADGSRLGGRDSPAPGCHRGVAGRGRRRARLTATFPTPNAPTAPPRGTPMTAETTPRIKITYATLRADNEELHAGFEAAVTRVKAGLGAHHRNYVDGAWRDGDGAFEVRSPIDSDLVLGTFARGTAADVDAAVAAARAAYPAWSKTPWAERLRILRAAAELISERLMDGSAVMAIEVGKNRIEALGEVEEAADLIRYYAQTAEDNAFYDHPMGNLGDSAVHTRSILRPHGVFAVVSPFNFPMALSTGPTSAAMLAGNTVVLKPSSASPLSAVGLAQAYIDAGVPKGVFNLVMGPGETVGQTLQDHPGIDGIVFTGSYEVGMRLFHSFSRTWPRPCIVEMGGKNPAIVTGRRRPRGGGRGDHALRVRVRRPEVLRQLARVRRARRSTTSSVPPPRREDRGDHRSATRSSGPTGWARSSTSARWTAIRARSPRRAATGRSSSAASGSPTATWPAAGTSSRPSSVACRPVIGCSRTSSSRRSRRSTRWTRSTRPSRSPTTPSTASRPASTPRTRPRWSSSSTEIEAGVLYVNRRAGATTGAWPGIQAFGGWKGSGSTGKAGLSMYYVAQFLREQSHTVVDCAPRL